MAGVIEQLPVKNVKSDSANGLGTIGLGGSKKVHSLGRCGWSVAGCSARTPDRDPQGVRGGVLRLPKGSGRGAFGGGVGKGVSRPNGIRRGRGKRGRRRSPMGGPKTLPSPVEPSGGAQALAAPETLRASAPKARASIGRRGKPDQPQVPCRVGAGSPCTSANQSLQQTAGHDSFFGTTAHWCPAAAELCRSAAAAELAVGRRVRTTPAW
jgi:hypothetical protein